MTKTATLEFHTVFIIMFFVLFVTIYNFIGRKDAKKEKLFFNLKKFKLTQSAFNLHILRCQNIQNLLMFFL